MGYAVYHSEKGNISSGGLGNHIDRKIGKEYSYVHADPEKLKFDVNIKVIDDKIVLNKPHLSLAESINKRISEGYNVRQKNGELKSIRKDAVKYITHVLTGTHEDMIAIFNDINKRNEWIKANYKWACKEFGEDNIVRFTLHLSEKTPHIHLVTVPLTEDGRLSAKEMMGNRTEYENRQTRYAEAMKPFNLQRGIEGSSVKHEDAKEYYKRINASTKDVKNTIEKVNKSIDNIKISRINPNKSKTIIKDEITKIVEAQTIEKNKDLINKLSNSEKVNARLTLRIREEKTKQIWLERVYKAREIPIQAVCNYLIDKGLIFHEKYKDREIIYKNNSQQKTGSLNVNIEKNKFFDFATNKKGNPIDLLIAFENLDFKEAIKKIEEIAQTPHISKVENIEKAQNKVPDDINFKIKSINNKITNSKLIEYAKSRGISNQTLDNSVIKEIYYNKKILIPSDNQITEKIEEKTFYALAFELPNGFVLRNEKFKGNIGQIEPIFEPKKGSNDTIVVEGMFDYLTIREGEKKRNELIMKFNSDNPRNKIEIPADANVLILNSTSNLNKAINLLTKMNNQNIQICLDGDKTGNNATNKILQSIPNSSVYLNLPNNQDLNEVNNLYYKAQEFKSIKLICQKIASAIDNKKEYSISISKDLAKILANFIAEDDKKTEKMLPLSSEKFANYLNSSNRITYQRNL